MKAGDIIVATLLTLALLYWLSHSDAGVWLYAAGRSTFGEGVR